VYHQCNLKEGLEQGDLKRLVTSHIGIDNYKSKMGDDADILVINFVVEGKDPAKDLMTFIERGYDFVLDADISSGEDDEGRWLVFVEMERSRLRPKQIMRLIDDILNLTDQKLDDWTFNYHKDSIKYPLNLENLEEQVPLSPKLYRERFGDKEMDQLKENARVPMKKKTVSNYYTDIIRVAAGLK